MSVDAETAERADSCVEKKKTGALWRLMKEKALETGVQGVPNIARTRDTVRRAFWILVVFAGTVLMTWQVTVSFMKFYTYPVKTQILYKSAGQVEFPAVTICNLNPLRVSQVCDDGMMSGFIKKYTPKDKSKKPSRFNDWTRDDGDIYSKEATEFSMIQSFLQLSAQLTPAKRRKIGHHLDTMLLSCTWHGRPCSPRNFTWFNNHRYGNCFTFNTNKTLVLNKPGSLYGKFLASLVMQ
ncbi:hypothetical protein NP493_1078g01004 [Ridgeia piscesae]|uniref:Uncharacterized protein n=1 Tax=Ridgeia piscesae TaxID=27915 RepID=A0AAD9KGV4_RIDPI|nr:hypothetical protein NP493_1078g01004 [Ridgeia piscesae]